MTNEEKLGTKARKLQLEMMREEVLGSELQARYWKARHDTKFYTLADAKLKDEYDAYVADMQNQAIAAAQELEATPDKNLTVESSVISAQ